MTLVRHRFFISLEGQDGNDFHLVTLYHAQWRMTSGNHHQDGGLPAVNQERRRTGHGRPSPLRTTLVGTSRPCPVPPQNEIARPGRTRTEPAISAGTRTSDRC